MEIEEYTKQPGSFLKAQDVLDNPEVLWEVTAEGSMVVSEKFGNQRLHLPVSAGGDGKIFDCSKTNARTISEILKDTDTKNWIGKLLELQTYKTKTSDGKMVHAIDIKSVK